MEHGVLPIGTNKKIIRLRKTGLILALGFIFLASIVFFFRNPRYYHQLDIVFSEHRIPYCKVKIQGKPYLLMMDTGAACSLSLKKEVLKSLKKTPSDFSKMVDAKGDVWLLPSYEVNDVCFGGHQFQKVLVTEENQEQTENTILSSFFIPGKNQSEFELGKIGHELLDKTNLILDFSHHVAYTINNPKGLKNLGIDLKEFAKVPFLKTPVGFIIHVHTDIGILRFVIDTGCTYTILKPGRFNWEIQEEYYFGKMCFYTKTFFLGGHDFGGSYIYLFNLDPGLNDFDGFIGMDFLKHHTLYIDFEESMLYIKRAT